MIRGVPTTERRVDRGAARARRQLAEFGREIREARVAAGLSQRSAGAASGVSHTFVSRIEIGRAEGVGFVDLSRLAAAVGLELSLRAYPGDGPVRDVAHLALLARLRARVAASLGWRTEVALSMHGDARAWDVVIYGAGPPIGVEAETRLRDVQAVERRIAVKLRDSRLDRAVLLLADTRWNRAAVRADPSKLRAMFPVSQRELLAALAAPTDPGGSGLVIL
jgi:transcriptional regulator with XRE-family HTH domain